VDAKPQPLPPASAPQATTASALPPGQTQSEPPTQQASNKPPPATPPARPLRNGLAQCPHCPSPVRPDRLQDHIARVHGQNAPGSSPRPQPNRTSWHRMPGRSVPPPRSRRQSSSSGSSIRYCACGHPAIPGYDYCYSCRPE
jgi:hypothetical protein